MTFLPKERCFGQPKKDVVDRFEASIHHVAGNLFAMGLAVVWGSHREITIRTTSAMVVLNFTFPRNIQRRTLGTVIIFKLKVHWICNLGSHPNVLITTSPRIHAFKIAAVFQQNLSPSLTWIVCLPIKISIDIPKDTWVVGCSSAHETPPEVDRSHRPERCHTGSIVKHACGARYGSVVPIMIIVMFLP
jgi:hypothetical protein